MINTVKLSADVAALRNSKNISMDVACKEVGISKPTFSRIERGVSFPDSVTLLKLCKWLDTNPMSYLN